LATCVHAPIFNPFAIHFNVIVVSSRNRLAMFCFRVASSLRHGQIGAQPRRLSGQAADTTTKSGHHLQPVSRPVRLVTFFAFL
jgi:hypothetical protein